MKTNRFLFMVIILSLIIMSACSDKKTTEPPTANTVTVKSIVVTSTSQIVSRGGQVQFSAEVIGTNNPAQTVTWSVITHTGSTIRQSTSVDAGGLLTVAGDEDTPYLTVIAKSTIDDTKSGWLTVSTTGSAPPTVTGVEISPSHASVHKGNTLVFTAGAYGSSNITQYITWSVTGGVNATNIAQTAATTALLTVSNNEPDFTYLTVRATYSLDSTKYAEAQVAVEPEGFDDAENWVYLENWDEDYDWGMTRVVRGYVDVEISRRTTPITSVSVKVNNVTVPETGYNESWSSGGTYYYEGEFLHSSTFVPGVAYAVELTVNGVVSSGNVTMVYKPSVTPPATFDRSRHMTFNWTLGANAIVQGVGFDGYTSSGSDINGFEGYIAPSIRSFLIEAYTVPANWAELFFFLFEANYVLNGKTMIVCGEEYYTSYYSGGSSAPRHTISRKEKRQRIQRLIKSS